MGPQSDCTCLSVHSTGLCQKGTSRPGTRAALRGQGAALRGQGAALWGQGAALWAGPVPLVSLPPSASFQFLPLGFASLLSSHLPLPFLWAPSVSPTQWLLYHASVKLARSHFLICLSLLLSLSLAIVLSFSLAVSCCLFPSPCLSGCLCLSLAVSFPVSLAVSLALSLSLSLSGCLSCCLCLFLSVSGSLLLSLSLSLSLSGCLSCCLCLFLSVSVSLLLSLSLSLSLSGCLSCCLCLFLGVSVSLWLSLCNVGFLCFLLKHVAQSLPPLGWIIQGSSQTVALAAQPTRVRVSGLWGLFTRVGTHPAAPGCLPLSASSLSGHGVGACPAAPAYSSLSLWHGGGRQLSLQALIQFCVCNSQHLTSKDPLFCVLLRL
ncbi:josephin-2 isoform X3 [Aotus nancymaae]|uniref:josephin-2 isoform X3 n=1 Tax=Aotus nancymaae TaxID=37293 RepID=UPI0030FE81DB